MKHFVVTWTFIAVSGCAGILPALQTASQIGQTIGSVLDVAERGTDVYMARHPNDERIEQFNRLMFAARQSLALYDRLVADSAATATQLREARARALDDYEKLRTWLDMIGVLEAKSPEGGAESDAPLPTPFDLPTRESLETLQ